jgi:D-galactarolactone cycloisomerase
LDIAVATGECEQTRWGFQTLLQAGAATILQPDMAYCGGPTEALKIRAMASAKGVNVIPHCWGTQLNLACATHFLATARAEPGRAEPQALLLEVDNSPNPMRTEIFKTSVVVAEGRVQVPSEAGLGVEPDLKELQRFCINQTEIKNDADVSHVDRSRTSRFEQTY